jgi:hypothetical protein
MTLSLSFFNILFDYIMTCKLINWRKITIRCNRSITNVGLIIISNGKLVCIRGGRFWRSREIFWIQVLLNCKSVLTGWSLVVLFDLTVKICIYIWLCKYSCVFILILWSGTATRVKFLVLLLIFKKVFGIFNLQMKFAFLKSSFYFLSSRCILILYSLAIIWNVSR